MFALGLATACSSSKPPHITSVSPTDIVQDGMFTIAGTEFCGASGDCATASLDVQIGTNSPFFNAPPQTYTATSVVAIMPPEVSLGSTQLVMTVDGLSSNGETISIVGGAI